MANRFTVYRFVLLHLFIWVLYFFFENGFLFILAPESITITSSIFYFILNAMVFYGNYFIALPRIFSQKKYVSGILIFAGLIVVYFLSNYYGTALMEQTGIKTNYTISPLKTFLVMRTIRVIYFISLSYAYWLATKKIQYERRLRDFEKSTAEDLLEKSRLEKEKLYAELNYLRYQINPHFLFNTLNFIYVEVAQHSEHASRSVLLLSEIMHYALNSQDDAKIEISKEIQHIRNLVEIHQLRFKNALYFNLESSDEPDFKFRRIMPLSLLTFVENIFKHGDLQDALKPAIAKISIDHEELRFYSHNKKRQNKTNMISTGIGKINLEKRLGLVYGKDMYTLDISDSEEFYTVNLNIKL